MMKNRQIFQTTTFAPRISQQAAVHMAHYNLSWRDLCFVIAHGAELHQQGQLIFVLRRCDIPAEYRSANRYARLEGTIVILNRTTSIVHDIRRNRRQGWRELKHRPRYRPMMEKVISS